MAPSVSGLKAMFGVTAACGAVFVFLQIAAPALVAWFGLEGTSFSAMNLAQASMSVWALASATPQDYAPVLQLQMVYKGCWVVQVAVAMARGAVPHDFGPCFGLGVMASFVLCDGLLFGRGAVRASDRGALHRELLLSS